jgi:hypothetical protein
VPWCYLGVIKGGGFSTWEIVKYSVGLVNQLVEELELVKAGE